MSRVLLKLSGEAIRDKDDPQPITTERLGHFTEQISRTMTDLPDLQLAIVIGGGNILRGPDLSGIDGTIADHMGMLATVINSLALADSLKGAGQICRVMSGVDMPRFAEPYIHGRAIRHLEKRRVVIFAAGTGSPGFTTDTAAALRASEINAEKLFIAKFGTDAIYDGDPRKEGNATKFSRIGYQEYLDADLQAMDLTAVTLCKERSVPIFLFDMDAEDALYRALTDGDVDGTLVGGLL